MSSRNRQPDRQQTDPLPYHERRGPRAMTGDELVVGRLDLLRGMAANPGLDQDCRIAAAAGVAEIEAGIRLQAARWSGPEHEAQVELVSTGRGPVSYMPALAPDGEQDSLETPRLMARRAALWARPDVVALVGVMCGRTQGKEVR